jgi:acyl-CoA dehydrogenase
MFDVFVRDFSTYAMDLYAKPLNTPEQVDAIAKMFKRPEPNPDEADKVLREEVYSLADEYIQNP